MTDDRQTDFDPEIPLDKSEPMAEQLDRLIPMMEQRMEAYEEKRAEDHWDEDHAHWHIEKAMGELSVAYVEAKEGESDEKMLREVADGVNHLMMALDIGAGHVTLDEQGRRVDDKSNTGG